MSRIHEALKKAEQERAVMLPVDVAALPTEPLGIESNGGNRTPVAAANVHPKTSVIASPPSDYLRFDDLSARCAHPRWQPDRNVNVFMNSDLSIHGPSSSARCAPGFTNSEALSHSKQSWSQVRCPPMEKPS